MKAEALRCAGVRADLLAEPIFLVSVGLNTWASVGYLHQLAWEFVGGDPRGGGARSAAAQARKGFRGRAARPVGVALILAGFRVDVPMLSGGTPATWNGWVHGIAFLLISATGVLAPLTMALAVRRDPGWRPITVVSVGQCRPAPPLQRWRRGSQGVR